MGTLGSAILIAIPIALWFATIRHLVRTKTLADSTSSQNFWLFLVLFMPTLGVPMYWLVEARRRRLRPPPALAG